MADAAQREDPSHAAGLRGASSIRPGGPAPSGAWPLTNPDPRRALRSAQLIWIASIISVLLAPGVGLLVQFMQASSWATGGQSSGNQWPVPLIFAVLTGFLIIEAIVLGLVIPAVLRGKAKQAWKKRVDDLTALKGIANVYATASIIRASLIVMPAMTLCAGLVLGLAAWWTVLLLPVLITLGFYQPKRRKMERFIAEATDTTMRSPGIEDPYGPRERPFGP